MDKKGAGILIVILFLGLFGGLGTLRVYQHNIAVQEYQPTDATIQDTDIIVKEGDDDDDTDYEPVVEYTYTVDGETYESDNVYPGSFTRDKGSRSGAESVTDQYNQGETVEIQHNPNEPSNSYLRNDGWPDLWWLGAGYAVILFASGGWLIWLGFKRRKQRILMEDAPTQNVQSLAIGPSEIKGEAVSEEYDPARAPFSKEDCHVAKYEIKEYHDDDDDSGGSWNTVKEDVLFKPFQVDDGTDSVLVKPHSEATYDLEPEDWETTYVDSGNRGPQPVREFVQASDDVSFPSDRAGKDNDRKYRQNLIRDGENVYVFGTAQPREETIQGGTNADRLVIKKVQDDAMREPMFLISDDEEEDLVERREWALWRLPVGTAFLAGGLGITLLMFAPLIGLSLPVL